MNFLANWLLPVFIILGLMTICFYYYKTEFKRISTATSENMPGKAVNLWFRIGAIYIDWNIFVVISETVNLMMPEKVAETTLVGSVFFLLFISYKLIFEYRYGKTIGKSLLGLQIISQEGGEVTFRKVVFRNLIFILLIPFFGIAYLLPFFIVHPEPYLKDSSSIIPLILYFILWIGNILYYIIDNNDKVYHDDLSKTSVVKVKANSAYFWWVILLLIILSNVVEKWDEWFALG